jgi:thiol-disulfide isomerase/thioredoxin
MSIRLLVMSAPLLLAGAALAEEGTGVPGLKKVPKTLEEAKAEAKKLEKLYEGKKQPEAVRMFIAITRGSQMGPGEGWFGPAQSRYGWAWLAKHCGVGPKEGITREKFKGDAALFARLDRDKDGRITAGDLDWSDRSPYVQMTGLANRLFRAMDAKGSGKITKKDLEALFDKAAGGKDHITADDLRDALMRGMAPGFAPGDGPSPKVLLKGLFTSEVGSLKEGPSVGDDAPGFELSSPDKKKTIKLSEVVGKKPVVLVFGNFTCGPFRALYPQAEAVAKRHKKDAEFLLVYVREAHPTDGWRMKSNDKVGVTVAQPKTTAERCDVAGKCLKALKPTMPLLVDDVDDKVGNDYSAMPARLYVIDPKGKVVYKSGRGPFGFKAGEMEQALVMCLLEAGAKKPEPKKTED